MSDHLRSAEDVALSFSDGWPMSDRALDALADLIRARDAEVRANERAEALAEVVPRIAAAVEHLRDYSCCYDVARILGSETWAATRPAQPGNGRSPPSAAPTPTCCPTKPTAATTTTDATAHAGPGGPRPSTCLEIVRGHHERLSTRHRPGVRCDGPP